jgi:hypothetical protein
MTSQPENVAPFSLPALVAPLYGTLKDNSLLGQVDSATTFSTTKLANHQTSTKHCPPAGGFKHGAETQCLEKSLKVFKVTGQYQ